MWQALVALFFAVFLRVCVPRSGLALAGGVCQGSCRPIHHAQVLLTCCAAAQDGGRPHRPDASCAAWYSSAAGFAAWLVRTLYGARRSALLRFRRSRLGSLLRGHFSRCLQQRGDVGDLLPLKPQASLDAHGAVLVVQDVPIGNTQPALQDDDLAARAQVGQVELARAIFQRQGQETRGRVDPLDAPVVVARVLAAVRPVQRLERMNLGAFVDEAGGPGRLTGQGGGQLGLCCCAACVAGAGAGVRAGAIAD